LRANISSPVKNNGMHQKMSFNRLVTQHQRLTRKLERLILHPLSFGLRRKRQVLEKCLENLTHLLTKLQTQLKLGAAAALTAGALFIANPSQAQITFGAVQTNPFGLPGMGGVIAHAFTDLDNDGDVDLMVGINTGNFKYFENTGSVSAPAFSAVQTNPFGLADVGDFGAPAFADLDNDGDMDLMAGVDIGNFKYFENIGSASASAFSAVQTNPFGLSDIGLRSTPAFTDLDNDGDIDLMAGELGGNFKYFENTTPPAQSGATSVHRL
jgi:uncharacterized protein YuzB (UPF0349 family)